MILKPSLAKKTVFAEKYSNNIFLALGQKTIKELKLRKANETENLLISGHIHLSELYYCELNVKT